MSNRVREFRERKHWTLDRLAAVTGLTPQQLSRIERGRVDPRGLTKQIIADGLGADRRELFPEDEAVSA